MPAGYGLSVTVLRSSVLLFLHILCFLGGDGEQATQFDVVQQVPPFLQLKTSLLGLMVEISLWKSSLV